MEKYTPSTSYQTQVESRDITDAWVNHILSFSETKDFSKLKIVVDGGNGAAGAYMQEVALKVGFEMVPLFLEPDGNFPNHHPNPMLRENRVHTREKIIET